MKLKKIITLMIIIFLTIQFAGRIIVTPINIIIYTGYSMQPAINHGDILICISKDIMRYDIGDMIVYYSGYMYYVAHRIVEIHGNQIFTKGDRAAVLDPPITNDYVKYKVATIIPYNIWITFTIIIALIFTIIRRKQIVSSIKSFKQMEVAVFIIFTISTLIMISTIPLNSAPIQSTIIKPSIELKQIEVLDHSKILIKYYVKCTYPKCIEKCISKIGNITIPLKTHLNSDYSIMIETPIELYQLAYNSRLERIYFELKIIFDKGCLEGNYTYTINWRRMDINVINKTILIFNPNYIPMNISSIKIMYVNSSEAEFTKLIGIEEMEPITISPEETYKLNIIGKAQHAYVELRYYLFEVEVIERKQIDFTK